MDHQPSFSTNRLRDVQLVSINPESHPGTHVYRLRIGSQRHAGRPIYAAHSTSNEHRRPALRTVGRAVWLQAFDDYGRGQHYRCVCLDSFPARPDLAVPYLQCAPGYRHWYGLCRNAAYVITVEPEDTYKR